MRGDLCDVVISELAAAGPNGADDEFIELYNGSNQPVSLAGWIMQYRATSVNSTWQLVSVLPAETVIPAKGFFLIVSGGASGYSGTPDGDFVPLTSSGTPRTISMSASAAHIRLVLPGGAMATGPTGVLISDTVGYGPAATAGEGSPISGTPWGTSAPYSASSQERKALSTSTSTSMAIGGADVAAGNNSDSNANVNDFVPRTTRQPQNAQSAVEPP